MTDAEKYVREKLFSLQDMKYKEFHSKLMPTVDSELVIGVRTPDLRRFAKDFSKNGMAEDFLATLPHKYYEENNLHAFIVADIRDFNTAVEKLNDFLPYVDNWATCDMMRPVAFKKHHRELLCEIEKWIESDRPYTVRFGIEMLMVHFLDDDFDIAFLHKVAQIKSEEYYVKMMVAWYFATALAYRYDEALPFIESKKLDSWIHNKTIQKAVESYRITDEQKKYLKTLKIKKRMV